MGQHNAPRFEASEFIVLKDSNRLVGTTTILIPAYGKPELLRLCLSSLSRHAPSWAKVYVLDDGTPDDSLSRCCEEQSFENLIYVRSDVNRGFVATCNWGWNTIAEPNSDILLLNSDTQVTAGFLEEMTRVLHLSERHAVVMPRSNSASLSSLPLPFSIGASTISPEESFEIWEEIRPELRAYQVVPTAVGFCMLIKAIVLERFGLFDEVYSPGYNEENDFLCRINRLGFSAALANHAYVYHYENSTFGNTRNSLDEKHRAILVARYPEYPRKVTEYLDVELDPVERFAGLQRRHRPRMLFDLSHLPRKHCGTSDFGLNLLRQVHSLMHKECDITIAVSEGGGFFANELSGYDLFEERAGGNRLFDLVFKPSQVFTWAEFMRMTRLAPRVAFVLQDIISVRCDHLGSVDLRTIFRKTIELADRVYAISNASKVDCDTFFGIDSKAEVLHHGTNFGAFATGTSEQQYVLVMGNEYRHKGLEEALIHLMDVGPVRIVGGSEPTAGLPPHMSWYTSGRLTAGLIRQLLVGATVLVYPSHYEGFGLPIIDALALGKKVVCLDNQLNRELALSLGSENLSLIRSFAFLRDVVLSKVSDNSVSSRRYFKGHSWGEVASNYVAAFMDLLQRPPDYQKLRARHDLYLTHHSAQHS